MVAKIMAVIGGAFVGGVVGSVIQVIVLLPMKNNPSIPDDTIKGFGAVILLVCMAVGAWIFYRRFARSRN